MISKTPKLSFKNKLQWVKNRINQILLEQFKNLPFNQTQLITAMQYGTLIGGKRIRPFLVYSIGEMLNVSIENLDTPAAAIECIHAYSLIHDDLPAMDNDSIRRGKPTCHATFGEAHAILAGDALQTLAFDILSNGNMPNANDHHRLAMIRELINASGITGMCSGQALEIESKGKIDTKRLECIHNKKTGALIRAAIRMSTFISHYQEVALLRLLDDYANTIGLMFQIHDDILDIRNDAGISKKNKYTNKKNTYPLLIGLNATKKKIKKLYTQALNILDILKKKYEFNTTTLKNFTNFMIKRKS
ncbi:(2E,6E)-farnesyl diphosphate synthase [Arsenophonus symbiont of Ornithomya chloropus]|uniref:(2E,6E)-farnesyl diphosphate synthase n=1 Tax=Arsenophonus symbiont of Ornithomya chloropus TaxID=634121 RepID=UPI0032B28A58